MPGSEPGTQKKTIMDKAYNITHISTAALCGLVLSALSILLRRAIKHTLSALRGGIAWLQAEHNFTPFEADEAERVYLPGWKYIIFSAAAVVVCVILSFQF